MAEMRIHAMTLGGVHRSCRARSFALSDVGGIPDGGVLSREVRVASLMIDSSSRGLGVSVLLRRCCESRDY